MTKYGDNVRRTLDRKHTAILAVRDLSKGFAICLLDLFLNVEFCKF